MLVLLVHHGVVFDAIYRWRISQTHHLDEAIRQHGKLSYLMSPGRILKKKPMPRLNYCSLFGIAIDYFLHVIVV